MFSKLNKLFFVLTVAYSLLVNYSFITANDEAYKYLDNLALTAGTDKSSAFHNYTKIYSKYFDSLRNEKIKFLEIGIYFGDSVKLWESYFPNADLYFVDINPSLIKYHSTRSQYHYVNQADAKAMHKLANALSGNFDVIIDDGGHKMDQQIISFQALFPYVKSGGLYIIEDLHTSYWKEYGGHGKIGKPASGSGTCTEFLKERIDDLNYTAGVTQCADSNKISPDLKKSLNCYQDNIEAIHFYKSLCIIIKK